VSITFQVGAVVESNPCIWAASETGPARYTYNLMGGEVSSVSWVETSTISITPESPLMCPGSIGIAGTGGRATVLEAATRIRVRLI
jgi:hypothetical protein